MGKKLAIRGHSTCGNEVIEILKMIGAIYCPSEIYALCENRCYSINDNGWIEWNYIDSEEIDEYKIFTLEEFLEKYPFKVGDLVDRNIDYVSCIIDNMRWNSEKCCVEYHAKTLNGDDCGWYVSECFVKNKTTLKIESTGFMQMGKTVSVIFNSANYEDEVELQLGDYEIAVRDGKTYAVRKKPKYPTTYDECVEIMGVKLWNTLWGEDATEYGEQMENLINALIKLKVCRDAYWKIAGEQMGLGKSWESPLPSLFETVYCIRRKNNKIIKGSYRGGKSEILEFPTEEMRDAFYENFKDLIEQCKELL